MTGVSFRASMKTHRIAGGGGVQLHAVEEGNPQGRPVLFLHGASQSCLQWSRQLQSSLANHHRLIALDMRGHGLSDKPRDAYGDSKLWADDVNAVIRTLSLDHPVLSGWSYGPLVILDYIRHYGDENVGGIQFIGAVTKLGTADAFSVLTPEFLAIVPQFLSSDAETSVSGLQALLRLCFVHQPSPSEMSSMVEYNVAVPPHVRQGLFSRTLNNDDVMAKIRKPVLITHGAADAIVKLEAVEQHKAAMPHAQVDVMENAGTDLFGTPRRPSMTHCTLSATSLASPVRAFSVRASGFGPRSGEIILPQGLWRDRPPVLKLAP